MSQKIYKSNASIDYLFITIDPSGGKDRNYYALTSMIFVGKKDEEQCVVCSPFFFNSFICFFVRLFVRSLVCLVRERERERERVCIHFIF